MDKREERIKVLNIFLTEIFDNQKTTRFTGVDINETNRDLYFKIWCGGVFAGLGLNDAVAEIKQLEGA